MAAPLYSCLLQVLLLIRNAGATRSGGHRPPRRCMKILLIDKRILSRISDVFLARDEEQGFLLGSSRDITRIDACFDLPAANAGLHYYEPNPGAADEAISSWAQRDICFCGMIHSHVVNKMELSENDMEFAKALYTAYHLPVLWFGIGIVQAGDVAFRMYAVRESGGQISITPEQYEIFN